MILKRTVASSLQPLVGIGGRPELRVPVAGSPLTVYVGLQLAGQYLQRWLDCGPGATEGAHAADGRGRSGTADGRLAITHAGDWRHDREALMHHTLQAWRLLA